ncbi:uncharacterized protein LOC115765079 isoform X2 [Drosophila novamexicana]|uniref:uncharacterized protein LOC115765079 isoform X2 n=1 Tax=Drosophila novamexicana TaxID=47314 RepID=UPI0011E59F9D|nr:uncharacterized protein LOC115765079 isoform X2 [Drosophila novamexicana]
MDIDERGGEQATRSLLKKTYKVTVIMLLVGQLQVCIINEISFIKRFLEKHYYVSLLQFFISFISIQLYVFFYHVIEKRALWKRILAGIWTFEVNTLSIMKPSKSSPYLCMLISFLVTFLIMGVSVVYGNMAVKHRRGLFVSRHNIIRWSERLFVLTCFGIIVSSEMKRATIEFPTLLVYSLMSNIFVVVYAASIRKPNFYQVNNVADHILIGQLYYLNFYALYMGIVWTLSSGFELANYDTTLATLMKKF